MLTEVKNLGFVDLSKVSFIAYEGGDYDPGSYHMHAIIIDGNTFKITGYTLAELREKMENNDTMESNNALG